MIKWIKRLFCKHEYKMTKETIIDNPPHYKVKFIVDTQCIKCSN